MTEELITIQEYARRFSVDTETVRSWVKKKLIPYDFVGGRKLVRKTDQIAKSTFVKPLLIEDGSDDPVI